MKIKSNPFLLLIAFEANAQKALRDDLSVKDTIVKFIANESRCKSHNL